MWWFVLVWLVFDVGACLRLGAFAEFGGLFIDGVLWCELRLS